MSIKAPSQSLVGRKVVVKVHYSARVKIPGTNSVEGTLRTIVEGPHFKKVTKKARFAVSLKKKGTYKIVALFKGEKIKSAGNCSESYRDAKATKSLVVKAT